MAISETIDRAGWVVDAMKVLASIEVLAGIVTAISIAASHTIIVGGGRAVAAVGVLLGSFALGVVWLWLAYVLQALLGIWASRT